MADRKQTDVVSARHGETPTALDAVNVSVTAESTPAAAPGLDGIAATERGVVDGRRRGWFWHWNNMVTQYAPLIGLKGVGLLNSYTVWTDRREESPHRGYAFPSQQSEADFYGEERSELITINKILVALDLIEIRKEMLTRVDERGRRWRVPHNLYRVKDRPVGADLTANEVRRVAVLADSDDAVFRYVRRVFSERFAPIGNDNVWHQILHDLQPDPTWSALRERTREIEERASARTRAGHKRRAATERASTAATTKGSDTPRGTRQVPVQLLDGTQQQIGASPIQPSVVAGTNTGSTAVDTVDVATANNGSNVVAAPGNTGSSENGPSAVAHVNADHPTTVGPSNTTYDQSLPTTTTTTSSARSADPNALPTAEATAPANQTGAAAISDPTETRRSADDRAGPSAAVRAAPPEDGAADVFSDQHALLEQGQADSNERTNGKIEETGNADSLGTSQTIGADDAGGSDGRRARGLGGGPDAGERDLADAAGVGPMVSASALVVSDFEAANDRRSTPLERQLLGELEQLADPAARRAGATGAGWVCAAVREAVASGSAFVAPKRIREIILRWAAEDEPAASTTLAPAAAIAGRAGHRPADVRLPRGKRGPTAWRSALAELQRTVDAATFERLFVGSAIVGYGAGVVAIEVVDSSVAQKLSGEYRALVERVLSRLIGHELRTEFVGREAVEVDAVEAAIEEEPAVADEHWMAVSAMQVDTGRQLWQTLAMDLAREVPTGDLKRMAGVIVLGQDPDGAIVLASPSPPTTRLIEQRYLEVVAAAFESLLGQRCGLRIVGPDAWGVVDDDARDASA